MLGLRREGEGRKVKTGFVQNRTSHPGRGLCLDSSGLPHCLTPGGTY